MAAKMPPSSPPRTKPHGAPAPWPPAAPVSILRMCCHNYTYRPSVGLTAQLVRMLLFGRCRSYMSHSSATCLAPREECAEACTCVSSTFPAEDPHAPPAKRVSWEVHGLPSSQLAPSNNTRLCAALQLRSDSSGASRMAEAQLPTETGVWISACHNSRAGGEGTCKHVCVQIHRLNRILRPTALCATAMCAGRPTRQDLSVATRA